MSENKTERKLKQDIGLVAAIALVVGMVIGSGIFMKPGKVIAAAGDPTMGLAAWVLGGAITVAAGLTVAELGAQIPKTGGLYAYLSEIYGAFWGYLFGWMQTLIYGPAVIGALSLYFSALLLSFFGLPEQLKIPCGIGAVLFLSLINCLGSKYGGYIQTIATAGKLIPIALIAIFGIWKGHGQVVGMTSGMNQVSTGMGAAILATLWAYDGWIGVGFVAGEMKNPARQLPKAIIIGLGIIVTAYIAVNIAMLKVLPASEIIDLGNYAAGSVAAALFGDMGGRLVGVGIIISIFGTLNGYILTNARVPYAMSLKGQLPGSEWLARVHESFGTPLNAIVLQTALSILLVLLGDPDRLTDIAMFIIWAFYILAFAAVFILRSRQTATKRGYRVPGYPLVPLIAICGALYIVVSTLLNKPTDSLYALGIVALGIPVYFFLSRKK